MDTAELDTFFHRYGRALAAGDLPGISGCYAYPSYVAGDTGSVVVTEPAQVETFFAGAAEAYRAVGTTRAVPALEQVTPLSAALVDIDVRWSYTGDDGAEHESDRFRYLVRHDDRQTVICVVTGLGADRGA